MTSPDPTVVLIHHELVDAAVACLGYMSPAAIPPELVPRLLEQVYLQRFGLPTRLGDRAPLRLSIPLFDQMMRHLEYAPPYWSWLMVALDSETKRA